MEIAFVEAITGGGTFYSDLDPTGGATAGQTTVPSSFVDQEGRFVPYPYRSLCTHSALFREFAYLAPSEDSYVGFVEKYGEPAGKRQTSYVSESGEIVSVFLCGQRTTGEERLDGVAEIRAMHKYVAAWDWLQSKANELAVDQSPQWPPSKNTFVELLLAWELIHRNKQAHPTTSADPEEDHVPIFLLPALISDKLRGGVDVQMLQDRTKHGKLGLHVVPRNLVAALWLQFADEVVGVKTYGHCAECGRAFRRSGHKDTMYCSPSCKQSAYRKRKKAIQLTNQGKSLEEIARQLECSVDTLRNLLS